jgi:hypothetical protein
VRPLVKNKCRHLSSSQHPPRVVHPHHLKSVETSNPPPRACAALTPLNGLAEGGKGFQCAAAANRAHNLSLCSVPEVEASFQKIQDDVTPALLSLEALSCLPHPELDDYKGLIVNLLPKLLAVQDRCTSSLPPSPSPSPPLSVPLPPSPSPSSYNFSQHLLLPSSPSLLQAVCIP